MFGNGKIFISHTHQDNALCDMLTAALDVWQTDYWIDLDQLSAGQVLFTRIQNALIDRDIFIRVCTPAAQQSPWMDQEELLAHSLRAPNRSGKRLIVNVIMAPGYLLKESERRDVVIDATKVSTEPWIHQLRQVLGIPQPGRHLNRRAFIGLGATTIAALGAMGFVGKLLLTPPAIPGYRPQVHEVQATPQASASRLLWKYALGTVSTALQGVSLSINESGIYGTTPYMLFSLDPANGDLRWQQFYATFPGQTAPALAGDTLYLLAHEVAINIGDSLLLIAASIHDGTERWHTILEENPGGNIPAFFAAPVTIAGDAIVAQYNDTTAAFDVTTHAVLWKQPHQFHEDGDLGVSPDAVVWAAPVVSEGVVYAGLPNGNLNAYSLATGQLLWSFTEASSAPIQSTPTIVNGVVYFGRDDGFCYAVEAQTGKVLWKQSLGTNTVGVSAPTVADGVVYLCAGSGASFQQTGSQADSVYALDAQSGHIRWQIYPSQSVYNGQFPAYSLMNQPLFLDGRLYVTGSVAPVTWTKRDVLYALDSTDGMVQWSYIVDGQGETTNNENFPSPPVAQNNVVYFVSSDATVYALATALV